MRRTRLTMARKVSVPVNPSSERSTTSLSICCFSPATRTSKNSSRFELVMQKNFKRSSKGLFGSRDSSTRWLNSSQLSSRLRKCSGPKLGVLDFTCATLSDYLRPRWLKSQFLEDGGEDLTP